MKRRLKLLFMGLILLAGGAFAIYSWPSKPLPGADVAITKTATVVAAGDIACDDTILKADNACHQEETAGLVDGVNPDTVLVLGDLQYPSATLERLQNFYDKSWGRFKDKTYPALGNHEYQRLGGGEGYFDYFNGAGKTDGRAGRRGQGYYSFNVGDWHLIALNSNCPEIGGCGPRSPQYAWLKQDLENNKKYCQLAFWHHPRFTSGRHEENGNLQPIWELLYRHRADLVLNGHNHAYERFAKQNPKRQVASDGIRQFIVGTGGRSHYQKTVDRPNAEIYRSGIFGVLKLELDARGYTWEYLPETPGFNDRGRDSCS